MVRRLPSTTMVRTGGNGTSLERFIGFSWTSGFFPNKPVINLTAISIGQSTALHHTLTYGA
ncbi:hypothetical protein Sp245p_31740 (plasmid) [Azospirillum baldaniorum]|uniref:Uncharacterized protein n=1 Tax=Azospirillum baldaniorum TaxID=1064539 RepID=A0A9P1K1N4_9PROT|nr:hypothetical protein Sp245p_31740 [Azospirillum baldaniorum]CCD03911.1 protein of unknown function [Azospirillum baldaniorum]